MSEPVAPKKTKRLILLAIPLLLVVSPATASPKPANRAAPYAAKAEAKHHPRFIRGPRGPIGPPGQGGLTGPTGPQGPAGPPGADAIAPEQFSGLVIPSASEPLVRGHNVAVRIASEDFPFGAWCIAVHGSGADMVVLTVSLLNNPEPSTEEPEIPAVQWNLQAPDCPDGQLQVETLVYVNGFPQHEPRPFSFTGEIIE